MRQYIKTCALFLVVLTTILTSKIFAQSKAMQPNWKVFIPKGYDTLATCNGDLNKDGQEDKVLILYDKRENKEGDEKYDFIGINRKLIILFKEGKGWKKAVQANNAIMCKGCGGAIGDPFDMISITNNTLVIKHYGGSAWRWGYTNRFRFQKNDFYLIDRTSDSCWNVEYCDKLDAYMETNYSDENLLTGQYEYRKMADKECRWLKNEKGKHAVKPLKKLTAFNIEI